MRQTLTRVINDKMATGVESPLNTFPASSHISLRVEVAVHMGKKPNWIAVKLKDETHSALYKQPVRTAL
jgi:hypothetical protein